MTQHISNAFRPLLDEHEPPCVSLISPTYRAGDQIQQNAIRFKNLLTEAEKRLAKQGLRQLTVQEFLEPTHQLLTFPDFWQNQKQGFAAFLSTKTFRYYRLPYRVEEVVDVEPHFYIVPLLPAINENGRFYLLALSQHNIRIFRGTWEGMQVIELPADIPKSLAETLQYDVPLAQLQYHSGTQASGGRTKEGVVYHGQGVGSDDKQKNILRHFQQINKGVRKVLQDETAPLVVAAVEFLHPIYREANTYPHLVRESILRNPEDLTEEELHRQTWQIIRPYFAKAKYERLERYLELAGKNGGISQKIREIVPAAHDGRIDTLFVAAEKRQWGSFDPETRTMILHAERQAGDEELLNLAAIQTLLHGGPAYRIEPDKMPPDAHKSGLAAIFRY